MSSGLFHLKVALLCSVSLFAGLFLVDLDHVYTHSFKELVSGFKGSSVKLVVRDDSSHLFHSKNFFYLCVLVFNLFFIGWFVHLYLDGLVS